MLQSSIFDLRPGMIIAEDVVGADSNPLLAAQTVLTSTHIAWLKSLAVCSVYIRNPQYLNIVMFPRKALEITKKTVLALVKQKLGRSFESPSPYGKVHKVGNLMDAILRNPAVLLHLTDIYNYDYRTFVHSVHVCLYSALTGLEIGYSRTALRELALGSLLHDLGKILVPSGILNKKESLCPDEWKIIQKHVTAGYQILRDHSKYIPKDAALVALHHHENYDGSGYASGAVGGGIHEFAEITSIADVYDAMSSDRSYRPALSPQAVGDFMMNSRGVRLNPDKVDLFLTRVVPGYS